MHCEVSLKQLYFKVVNSSDATKIHVDSTRTSSQTWINDEEPGAKFLVPFSRKLEFVSELKIVPSTSSHQLQLALYGPSHHYEVHLDSFIDSYRVAEDGKNYNLY